jgi:hypothetical protein
MYGCDARRNLRPLATAIERPSGGIATLAWRGSHGCASRTKLGPLAPAIRRICGSARLATAIESAWGGIAALAHADPWFRLSRRAPVPR